MSAFLFNCSDSPKKEKHQITSEKEKDSTEISTEYQLIRDNLYSDNGGNLYLKSRTRERFETGKWIDVWIKTVYCDSCWTPTEDGWKDITELKDFVDTSTWVYDTTNGVWSEYTDKNYRYHHTHMADGGTISLTAKEQ